MIVSADGYSDGLHPNSNDAPFVTLTPSLLYKSSIILLWLLANARSFYQ